MSHLNHYRRGILMFGIGSIIYLILIVFSIIIVKINKNMIKIWDVRIVDWIGLIVVGLFIGGSWNLWKDMKQQRMFVKTLEEIDNKKEHREQTYSNALDSHYGSLL